MKVEQAVKHFGTKIKVAAAAGVSPAAVTRWGEIVPLRRAWALRDASKGKLAMHLADYRMEIVE